MNPELDRDMDRILATAQRAAAPRAGDRERISSALRSRLSMGMADGACGGTLAAASTAGAAGASVAKAALGRSGWITIVMMTGVVTGALGFVLGYDMRDSHDVAAAVSPGAPLAPRTAQVPARHTEGNGTAEAVIGGVAEAHSTPTTTLMAPRAGGASSRERAPDGAASRSIGVSSPRTKANDEPDWPFAEVLERLHRANVALRRGQASLALIQLAELDRRAGEVLREEREVTRVLALCASGETQAAKRAAAPLRAGSAQSIYAHRLEMSCAREP